MFARALCLENGEATSFWKLSSKSSILQVAQPPYLWHIREATDIL
jgi:hypothetical protein